MLRYTKASLGQQNAICKAGVGKYISTFEIKYFNINCDLLKSL